MVSETVRKILSAAALVCVAGLLLYFASPTTRQGAPNAIGKEARDFRFEHNGRAMRLADLRGQVVVLNFWATWCPPCVREMPALERLHGKMGQQGVVVLGVSVDSDKDAYEKFLRDQNITFMNFNDPARRISESYGTFMYPETYIIAPDGTLARKIIGEQEWDSAEWVSYFRSLTGK
jgi:peroxiredoxin